MTIFNETERAERAQKWRSRAAEDDVVAWGYLDGDKFTAFAGKAGTEEQAAELQADVQRDIDELQAAESLKDAA